MASGTRFNRRPQRATPRGAGRWALAGLALASSSCVPIAAREAPLALGESAGLDLLIPTAKASAPNRARPPYSVTATAVATAAASAATLRGRTPLDQLRSLDCLAQAIYYEAASESEQGQRAVAQVVLNRVRHPAWPNSVCGVVYQGPMRPGGGCQFTFTCDGSLVNRPAGTAWERARLLAAEALAGRVEPSVGLATHYHTHAVSPSWAPGLVPAATIGAHIFYSLPGAWGSRTAFTARYSGSEPLPRPTMSRLRRSAVSSSAVGLAPLVGLATEAATPAAPAELAEATLPAAPELPPSTIREEYRASGQWRADAPTSITGQ